MQGFQVKRKGGWDTHGLPVELGVEKELGITKEDIGKKSPLKIITRNAGKQYYATKKSGMISPLKWVIG